MKTVILVTGASSGFGALTARALAKAGHVVYGSMTDIRGHNAPQVEATQTFSAQNHVDLRAIELDVTSPGLGRFSRRQHLRQPWTT
jgi:NAD(P)-dependent dehydrogenase (short-subunit alcohol dehydrogenase family)